MALLDWQENAELGPRRSASSLSSAPRCFLTRGTRSWNQASADNLRWNGRNQTSFLQSERRVVWVAQHCAALELWDRQRNTPTRHLLEEKTSADVIRGAAWSQPSQTTVERRFIGGRRTERRMQTQTSLARPISRPECLITPLAWQNLLPPIVPQTIEIEPGALQAIARRLLFSKDGDRESCAPRFHYSA